MPIKDYTTSISPKKSISEITQYLVDAGADGFHLFRDAQGEINGLAFNLRYGDEWLTFQLPSRWEGVQKCLCEAKVERRYQTAEHAKRVAWRNILHWVVAQSALIESGAAELVQVFLPYMVNREGVTLFEQFKRQHLILPSGSDAVDREMVDGY